MAEKPDRLMLLLLRASLFQNVVSSICIVVLSTFIVVALSANAISACISVLYDKCTRTIKYLRRSGEEHYESDWIDCLYNFCNSSKKLIKRLRACVLRLLDLRDEPGASDDAKAKEIDSVGHNFRKGIIVLAVHGQYITSDSPDVRCTGGIMKYRTMPESNRRRSNRRRSNRHRFRQP